jgi:hypothetical protein
VFISSVNSDVTQHILKLGEQEPNYTNEYRSNFWALARPIGLVHREQGSLLTLEVQNQYIYKLLFCWHEYISVCHNIGSITKTNLGV